jgi:hypothetical protein
MGVAFFLSYKMDELEFSMYEDILLEYENIKRSYSPFCWNNPLLSDFPNSSYNNNNNNNNICLGENVDDEKFSECCLINEKFIKPFQDSSISIFSSFDHKEESSFVIEASDDFSSFDRENSSTFASKTNFDNISNNCKPSKRDCFFETKMIPKVSEIYTNPLINIQYISSCGCNSKNNNNNNNNNNKNCIYISFPSFNNDNNKNNIVQNNIIQDSTIPKNEIFDNNKKINCCIKTFQV